MDRQLLIQFSPSSLQEVVENNHCGLAKQIHDLENPTSQTGPTPLVPNWDVQGT